MANPFLNSILVTYNLTWVKALATCSRSVGSKLLKLLGRKGDEVSEIAKVLAGMMLMGMEKRARCVHYDPSRGICRVVKLSYRPPWMEVVEVEGEYYIKVSKHPEVCATCPFWKPIDGAP